VLGGLSIGDLSEKIVRKNTLSGVLVLIIVAYAMSALAITGHTISLFTFSRFVSGFIGIAFKIAETSVVDISISENKARNLSYVMMSVSLDFIIRPAITSFSANGLFVCNSLSALVLDCCRISHV